MGTSYCKLLGVEIVAHKSACFGSNGFLTVGIPDNASSIGLVESLIETFFQTIDSALTAGDRGRESAIATEATVALNVKLENTMHHLIPESAMPRMKCF